MENNNKEELDNKKEIKIKLRTIIIIGIVISLIIVGIVVFANVSQNSGKNTNNKNGSTYIPSNSTNTNTNGSSTFINPSSMDIDYKPIIYLYPKETTELTVH